MGTRESTSLSAAAASPRGQTRGRRRSRRPRNADPHASTRVDILKSAAAAFRRLGYHGATVEQIAAALHMKKGNLYYYFKNKEEILFACHQYSLDRLMELLAEIEEAEATPDQKLRRLIVAFVHTILDELHGTALFLDLEALSPAHLKAVIVRRDRFDHGMRQIVEQGIASGLFAASDAKLLSFAILGAVNWIPRWFNPAGPSTSQQIADRFADYLIAGLKHA
ncbi:MAG TPA: TetR/AcrR family transcriptional regulator [Vicinamibacterales bacterium]|jgi:AcrR family transcriptional regulator|nr:TetR/AcrR family transcriptional regulator [Vicinamibacterales bacterium]